METRLSGPQVYVFVIIQIADHAFKNLTNDVDDSILGEINDIGNNLQICQECDAEDMKKWLNCDKSFQIMSDDEIAGYILQTNEQQEIQIENEKEENADAKNTAGPSQTEAFQVLKMVFKWFEKQSVIP